MNWSSWSCCELWSETENEQVHGNFYHGSLLVWKQMTSKIQQKVYGRLVLRKCDINSDTACVQCINHLCAFEPWEKNEESAVGPNVEPKTPIAGVADWPDCILGFCRSLPQNMPAHVDARKQACGKFTAVANAADLYKDTCAVLGDKCKCSLRSHSFALTSPIITCIPWRHQLQEMDLHEICYMLLINAALTGWALNRQWLSGFLVLVTKAWFVHSSIRVMISMLRYIASKVICMLFKV